MDPEVKHTADNKLRLETEPSVEAGQVVTVKAEAFLSGEHSRSERSLTKNEHLGKEEADRTDKSDVRGEHPVKGESRVTKDLSAVVGLMQDRETQSPSQLKRKASAELLRAQTPDDDEKLGVSYLHAPKIKTFNLRRHLTLVLSTSPRNRASKSSVSGEPPMKTEHSVKQELHDERRMERRTERIGRCRDFDTGKRGKRQVGKQVMQIESVDLTELALFRTNVEQQSGRYVVMDNGTSRSFFGFVGEIIRSEI
ncbi:hypothetical protein K438DRAFT_668254 [Mycena galopus ATCC 62051]|nr:hypothetical protein K438DRAFT_668254 [Mycena galopus ATCC 62051]